MAKELKKRSEVAVENTWKVEDLYPNDEAFLKDLDLLKSQIPQIQQYKGVFTQSAEKLLEFYKKNDELTYLTYRLIGYAGRMADVDTANSKYQGFMGSLYSTMVQLESASSFTAPELLALSDETLEKYYSECKDLELYRDAINETRRLKDHILSAREEELLAMAGDVLAAPDDINGMLNDADMVYPEITDAEGNKVRITHGNFIPLLESSDRRVRKETFEGLYSVYKQFRNTSAAILDSQTKGLLFRANAKKYESTLHCALDRTNVNVNVYHNLIDTVHKNFDKMHKYIRLRKKLMKLDELHMYDLYTPIVANADIKIPFEEAKQIVTEALKPLGEDYISVLKQGFENRWIDVYENEGKRSGAYSMGIPVHPYVLLNYADTLDSMFTLIHEMGHALHSYFSFKNQPIVYSDYKIFVAEVASTCNEALLMRYLLNTTTDKVKRAYLINHFLEGFRTTLYRQTMFAEFELKINEMTARGEKLTADELNKIYRQLNIDYYGEDIVVDEQIDIEWARIPHFYYNYYVFQYATGYSAAVALSEKILTEGAPAVEKYLKFLGSGCTKDPVSLLADAGVDMSTSEPIDRALKVFGELIDEMDKIME